MIQEVCGFLGTILRESELVAWSGPQEVIAKHQHQRIQTQVVRELHIREPWEVVV